MVNGYDSFHHPLIILNSDISQIKSYAIDSGLLFFDSTQLTDNLSAPESPYETKKIGMVNIGATDFYLKEGLHYLKLDPRFIIGTNNLDIDHIVLKFDNGQPDIAVNLAGIPISEYANVSIEPFAISAADSIINIVGAVYYGSSTNNFVTTVEAANFSKSSHPLEFLNQ